MKEPDIPLEEEFQKLLSLRRPHETCMSEDDEEYFELFPDCDESNYIEALIKYMHVTGRKTLQP